MTTSTTAYPSRRAAIDGEILPRLGDTADKYDIEALADKTLEWIPDGYGAVYFLNHTTDFWAEAAECAL